MRRQLPHARTHLFPGAGHLPQIERADDWRQAVSDYWSELDQ